MGILLLACCPLSTLAHPLGNFTISHFARLEIGQGKISVHYVIDLAEIPTFQELQRINSGGTSFSKTVLDDYLKQATQSYADGLRLVIDDTRVPLAVTAMNLSRLAGAAGMETMRIECDFAGSFPPGSLATHQLRFADDNYGDRIGWRELVVSPHSGISVFNSSAYANTITEELKAYPGDMLAAPLDERRLELLFTGGSMPSDGRPLLTRDGRRASAASRDRLTELISVPQLTPGVMLLGLLTAVFLGGLHAMSPGHGKAIVAAYLVGSRGTVRHAGFLGLTVTITHTSLIFALGLATLLASEFISPERLFPPLTLISGVIVAGMGFSLLNQRLKAIVAAAYSPAGWHTHHDHPHSHHSHEGAHSHDHDHRHDHRHDDAPETIGVETHTHLPPGADGSPVTWRSLLALGISGGILPCPSALVVLLAAITFHRVGYGLLLVVAFSLGLASALSAVGIAFVYAGRLLKPSGRFDRVARLLPLVSALVIAGAGVAICYGALDQAGIFG